MKKSEILMFVLLLFGMVLPAYADGIWAPMDEFIMNSWDPKYDMTCLDQKRPYFHGAGEDGSVTAMKTPLDKTPVHTWPNDTEFRISYVCGKGSNLWGAVQSVRLAGETVFTDVPEESGVGGYIPLKDLVISYDTESFTRSHEKEIRPFDEKHYDFCSAGEFALWMVPNSGVQIKFVTAEEISMLCKFMKESDGAYKRYSFGGTYTDEEGKRWAEFTYNGREHGWFCLDRMTEGGVRIQSEW